MAGAAIAPNVSVPSACNGKVIAPLKCTDEITAVLPVLGARNSGGDRMGGAQAAVAQQQCFA
jgi:hypothetical protein